MLHFVCYSECITSNLGSERNKSHKDNLNKSCLYFGLKNSCTLVPIPIIIYKS